MLARVALGGVVVVVYTSSMFGSLVSLMPMLACCALSLLPRMWSMVFMVTLLPDPVGLGVDHQLVKRTISLFNRLNPHDPIVVSIPSLLLWVSLERGALGRRPTLDLLRHSSSLLPTSRQYRKELTISTLSLRAPMSALSRRLDSPHPT
jgi:hypothetical protein